MPEATETATERGTATERDPVTERMLTMAGLGPLVAEAEAVWRSRATSAAAGPHCVEAAGPHCVEAESRRPGWRPFEDAFPTFYQFTNRPPR